jgi:putative SOS response-associated peptidase YedK
MSMGRVRQYDFADPVDVARYRAAMRENASRRPQEWKRCVICGTEFLGWAKRQYCSNPCNQKAWYYRHRGEGPAREAAVGE